MLPALGLARPLPRALVRPLWLSGSSGSPFKQRRPQGDFSAGGFHDPCYSIFVLRRSAVAGAAALAGAMLVVWHWRSDMLALVMPLWIETTPDVACGPYPENPLDVMRSRLARRAPRPGVVVFHGGAGLRGERAEMRRRVRRRYISQGFVAANIEYGRGLVFAAEDAVRAVNWFARNAYAYGVDPGGMVVTGESAGGHLALLAGFTAEAPVRAVVNFHGVSDIASLIGAPLVRKALPQGDTQAVAERLSPIRWVRPGICPVLSVHATADPLVPFEQSARLTADLQQAGGAGAAELVEIESNRHGLSASQAEGAYRAVFNFLDRHGVFEPW